MTKEQYNEIAALLDQSDFLAPHAVAGLKAYMQSASPENMDALKRVLEKYVREKDRIELNYAERRIRMQQRYQERLRKIEFEARELVHTYEDAERKEEARHQDEPLQDIE